MNVKPLPKPCRSIKIGVIFSNYGPYHVARVKAAYHTFKVDLVEVIGIQLARSSKEYPWEISNTHTPFELVTVFSDYTYEKIPLFTLIRFLFQNLYKQNIDVVAISGYGEPAMIATLVWAKLNFKKVILLSESKQDDSPRIFYKEIIKKLIVSQYDAALVGGKPHKRYLEKLGMLPDSIFLGYDVVDNQDFAPNHIKILPKKHSNPYFLSINRFIPKKNILFLLQAYAKYYQDIGDKSWDLILCGDGEMRSQIENEITNLGISDRVKLTGFLQQNELLPYFAHAQCFIHASIQEQWGLVVNEAMSAGLPILVSSRCGCYEDLIVEGVNGFGFDPENAEELTNLMLKMSSGQIDLEEMGKSSLKHIEKYSPDYFAQGLKNANKFAMLTD